MEQFNPCLRNFIAMGKNYEKALSRDVLFQMAEVHRQIQVQLEEMLKCFHNELLSELEKKVELDARYLTAALKKYQMEHKSKGESLEKCQGELKKLRRKSQGSKNPSKYGEKELQRLIEQV
ncbi:brain-specific angiogenesis inhibitor 1-associated protein 2-like [Sinocyclocheilus grahami]|uniref:brain-specific angiogenesis inhibitor 1-associated protein 2-like n=1 Tax=Sinocyclocheilus grahami TaxID=75366 RepID=UPI0007ACEF6A|nr:PREDICTED: brain-specific angiogenesis inhibitor 1-associated protein 2-like [Sinocyclocheilus grahami]